MYILYHKKNKNQRKIINYINAKGTAKSSPQAIDLLTISSYKYYTTIAKKVKHLCGKPKINL